MKILTVHNSYQQPGGEDVVVHAESQLLESHGHSVRLLEADNKTINDFTSRLNAGTSSIFSWAWKKKLLHEIESFRPDIVHVHNFLPLISPSVHWAASEAGIPSVQTLHNYRLICPNALLFRSGHVCEDCLGKLVPWPGVVHACYRSSPTASGAVAFMLCVHRALRTWVDKVSAFIALSRFSREKFIQGGLPPEKIVIKPNFTEVEAETFTNSGEFALFAGRLTIEKGVRTLLSAWQRLAIPIPIRIYGDGPLFSGLKAESARADSSKIYVEGRVPHKELLREIAQARFVIFPSECYENFPMTIVEAFAFGVPVIASRMGAIQEIVSEGSTGLLFKPGDPQDLARKVEWAWSHGREMREMGAAARKEYEIKYTPEANYKFLTQIYNRVLHSQQADCSNC